MMSQAGNERAGFTLVEVLLAVTILAFGIIGVIRAYVVLMSGIDRAAFMVETSYLAKNKMADAEEAEITGTGISPGTRSGRFEGNYPRLSWEVESSEVRIEAKESVDDKDKAQSAILNKVRVSVVTDGALPSARKISLYTYLEGRVK